jgi:hypothetical protein
MTTATPPSLAQVQLGHERAVEIDSRVVAKRHPAPVRLSQTPAALAIHSLAAVLANAD